MRCSHQLHLCSLNLRQRYDLRRAFFSQGAKISLSSSFFFLSRTSRHASLSLHFPLGVFCDVPLSLFGRFPVDRNRRDNFWLLYSDKGSGFSSPVSNIIFLEFSLIKFFTFFPSYSNRWLGWFEEKCRK